MMSSKRTVRYVVTISKPGSIRRLTRWSHDAALDAAYALMNAERPADAQVRVERWSHESVGVVGSWTTAGAFGWYSIKHMAAA